MRARPETRFGKLRRGDRGPLVLEMQQRLNEVIAGVRPDGVYGATTQRYLEQLALEALSAPTPPMPNTPIPIDLTAPPVWSVWQDRRGVLEPTENAGHAKRLGFERVHLMVNSATDDRKWFVDQSELRRAIDVYRGLGLGVDLTAWAFPNRRYADRLVEYVQPAFDDFDDLRIDLDGESAIAQSVSRPVRLEVYELWRDAWGQRIRVNDYATLQDETELLLSVIPDAVACPQAYSVSYVVRRGQRIDTDRDSVYMPGRTQHYAMAAENWGQRSRLAMGLSAYKPFETGPVRISKSEQLRLQVQAAREYNPSELSWWSLQTILGSGYEQAIQVVRAELDQAGAL